MNPEVKSSAQYIGQLQDIFATKDLIHTVRSFELSQRARELRNSVEHASKQTNSYVGLQLYGPFAIASPLFWNSTFRAVAVYRAGKMDRQAKQLLPTETNTIEEY